MAGVYDRPDLGRQPKGTRVKLLITGGAGYIGGVVTRQLLDAGHQVVIIDDMSTGHAEALAEGAQFHKMSVHDVAEILTPEAAFDGVLHFAAKIVAGESMVRPELYWDTNIRGSLALLNAVRAAGVPRLIFSSTGSMYQTSDQPFTEDSPIAPANPYASSKLAVDLMIKGECDAHGLGAASLRYFNAAGASGDLGERHDPETHLIPIVLEVAAGKREFLPLYGDDYPTVDGTCVRDYIHVEDLAAAHLLALDAITPGQQRIFNLGNGSGYTNSQVVAVAREVTGVPIPVRLMPRRDGDPVTVVASARRAQEQLGWVPTKPDLHQIIGDAWSFTRRARLS
jgi:UDP-glucose 4-epimerase